MYSGFFHNFAFQKKHLFMIPANLTHYIETEIIPRLHNYTDPTERTAVWDPDPYVWDAPHRRIRYRGALEIQGSEQWGNHFHDRNRRRKIKLAAYWQQLSTAMMAGAEMIYVAMFDEVDEGTAIFKCTGDHPVSDIAKFIDMDGQPSDHYLWLTGEAARMLRKEIPLTFKMPVRN